MVRDGANEPVATLLLEHEPADVRTDAEFGRFRSDLNVPVCVVEPGLASEAHPNTATGKTAFHAVLHKLSHLLVCIVLFVET